MSHLWNAIRVGKHRLETVVHTDVVQNAHGDLSLRFVSWNTNTHKPWMDRHTLHIQGSLNYTFLVETYSRIIRTAPDCTFEHLILIRVTSVPIFSGARPFASARICVQDSRSLLWTYATIQKSVVSKTFLLERMKIILLLIKTCIKLNKFTVNTCTQMLFIKELKKW